LRKRKSMSSKYFLTKKEFIKEVANYDSLNFFKKSKNILIIFIVLTSVPYFFSPFNTFALTNEMAYNPSPAFMTYVSFSAFFNIVHFITAVFIFFNHRWAMRLFFILFIIWPGTLASTYFQGGGVDSNLVLHAFFGLVALALTYRSYVEATVLKKYGL
jgi:hypothetical protein